MDPQISLSPHFSLLQILIVDIKLFQVLLTLWECWVFRMVTSELRVLIHYWDSKHINSTLFCFTMIQIGLHILVLLFLSCFFQAHSQKTELVKIRHHSLQAHYLSHPNTIVLNHKESGFTNYLNTKILRVKMWLFQ